MGFELWAFGIGVFEPIWQVKWWGFRLKSRQGYRYRYMPTSHCQLGLFFAGFYRLLHEIEGGVGWVTYCRTFEFERPGFLVVAQGFWAII